ncbi:MAG: choice-of-anchor Q domain-containing protein [Anaerolineales bacterium]
MKPRKKFIILLIFGFTLIILASCTPTPNCSATYTVTKTADTNDGVCSPGDCSLREAVLNANACPGSHTINLPAGGYALTLDGDDEDLGETGDLDITDDLTIIGTGAPSINGGIERSFHIHSGATVVFDLIWLTGGSAIFGGGMINEGNTTLTSFTCNYNSVAIPPGGMGDAMGGCIFNTGNLTILGGHFLANTAGYGGAIYNYDSAVLTIEDADFYGNVAGHGGAIWNGLNASLTINGGLYRLNEAAVNGGAIWNHGTTNGENLIFEENQAAVNGGGFFNWNPGVGYFTNSWFTLNEADLGGGLYNGEGMVHLYQSGLTENTATTGGGINNQGPAPSTGLLLKNVTVSANTATSGLGGGIYTNSHFDFRFITVANNSGEGLRIDGGSEIKLRSSALANNSGGNCAGMAPDSLDYNIESDGSCALAGPHDLTSIDPLLEPLGFHGGMSPSHALAVGSPAIDSGVPDLCTAIDQNGTTRPQGAWCDRGAHENVYSLGIVRGWTYIDSNNIRDPAEAAVSDVILELKEGPCPGGAITASAVTNPDGFYEIMEIDPGNYCLITSPLQQTFDPTFYNLYFASGEVLDDINFYHVPKVPDASASGLVWHDLCAVPYSPPSTPPPGCVDLGGGNLAADGIYDLAEPGIGGLLVRIGTGPCPISLILTEVPTNSNGEFNFAYLFGGSSYCIEIDALSTPNDTVLIPGGWTYPVRGAVPAQVEIFPAVGEDLVDIKFGWDYQFLPSPLSPYSYICTVNRNAFLRTGPSSSDYPTVTGFLKGHQFEVLAKSGPDRPGYYYGQDEALIKGWIAKYLLDCIGLNEDLLEIEESPEVPPTPTPIPCTRDLPTQEECEATGGTWETPITSGGNQYCLCP